MDIMIKHILRDVRVQFLIGFVGLIAIIGGGWLLYKDYRRSMNERAQLDFSIQLSNLERLQQGTASQQAWEDIEQGFAQAYQKYASSDLAPFYEAFQSEAVFYAGKPEEAIRLLEEALKKMGSSNPLYYLYKTKLQILRLGSADQLVNDTGKKELHVLAEDIHNPYRGFAWYSLWHEAWVAGNHEAAEAAYEKLTAFPNNQWAYLAQAKMEFVA